ncbi:RNA polymerase subunit sigma-70, partial [Actinomadura physcomitrii]|uniref:RNA polymerase subunit sigma-70 n=1 Tax=Actinomadura physcomitrii TaxID=2650748 RepID=UPI001921C1B7
MADNACRVCGKALPRPDGRPGRASVYCSAACRQKAYRTRRAGGDAVHDLISDIQWRARTLAPERPEPFYADVRELSSSVGRLRRIARAAADATRSVTESVTPADVTNPLQDEIDFAGLVEPHRRELQVHCYRMVGSYDDSEDLVQETLLKAWRNRDRFEGRSSLRTWLYTIATNACLDFLRRNERRPQQYAPSPVPPSNEVTAPPFLPWLQPFPDDPEAVAETAETLELVFLAAIQHLPPGQRAVLIMRDVLGWPAADTAAALDLTVASVTSALDALVRNLAHECGPSGVRASASGRRASPRPSRRRSSPSSARRWTTPPSRPSSPAWTRCACSAAPPCSPISPTPPRSWSPCLFRPRSRPKPLVGFRSCPETQCAIRHDNQRRTSPTSEPCAPLDRTGCYPLAPLGGSSSTRNLCPPASLRSLTCGGGGGGGGGAEPHPPPPQPGGG